jgi:Mg-chelatase subunit ChlD
MSLDLEMQDAPSLCRIELRPENSKPFISSRSCLKVECTLERQTFTFNNVHNFWALLTLQSDSEFISPNSALGIDFVIIIDISASMNLDSKLSFVKATIEYMLSKLHDCHRFSLVVFNHNVHTMFENLPMTEINKQRVRELLLTLEANGSTNMAEALVRGLQILQRRPPPEAVHPSVVMLFTDGLSNRCASGRSILDTLQEVTLPQGCTINTFGYGEDHDSKLLHTIAMRAQGVYYYVQTPEAIAATFGECIAGILSTRAYSIRICLRAQDGCRIVALATPYPTSELRSAKDYDVMLGSIYQGESKSVLLRLSLRNMSGPTPTHQLVKVGVHYVNALSGQTEHLETSMAVLRSVVPLPEPISLQIDQHINRYLAATAISEAIELGKQENFKEAQSRLMKLIEKIESSVSAHEPYCVDLVKDIKECLRGMRDYESFVTGIYCAQAYSEMYFLERSTGSKHLRKVVDGERHSSYGYTTFVQEQEAQMAMTHTRYVVFELN